MVFVEYATSTKIEATTLCPYTNRDKTDTHFPKLHRAFHVKGVEQVSVLHPISFRCGASIGLTSSSPSALCGSVRPARLGG